MSEKISLEELICLPNRSALVAAIMNALGSNLKEDYGIIPGETKEIEFDFKINGREASLKVFLDHLMNDWDRQIEVEAAKLLRKSLGDGEYEAINNIQRMLKDLENSIFEKYFPNDPEYRESIYR